MNNNLNCASPTCHYQFTENSLEEHIARRHGSNGQPLPPKARKQLTQVFRRAKQRS